MSISHVVGFDAPCAGSHRGGVLVGGAGHPGVRLGLMGTEERAASIGASLRLRSLPGSGAEVALRRRRSQA